MTDKDSRKHGLIFGRGDELGDDVEPPPTAIVRVTPIFSEPIPFGSPPSEDVELTGDIPWELRNEAPSDPTVDTAGSR